MVSYKNSLIQLNTSLPFIIIMHPDTQQNQQSKQKASFYIGHSETTIQFNSAFDSGNARVVKQVSDYCYKLECVEDCSRLGRPVNSKSWFYFSVRGFPKKVRGRFIITKVQALISIFYSKYARYYRPVYRINGQQWQRLPQEAEINLGESGDIECVIEYVFDEEEKVEFAFCYPYQFQTLQTYLNRLDSFKSDKEIYYHKELLVESSEKRPIHLLTITNKQELTKDNQQQQIFDNALFPEKSRPIKFKRPVILLTARVHPGETPASYAMQGVINFLLDKTDLRAHLLRQMFVFMIVPMINVDGVYHGHFRMDIHGKNLNRFYIDPNLTLQPAIYGIKELAKHLISSNRLSFYFDLHGHNAKKGCFIYGNAFYDFVQQVESQVFCKLLAMNHSGFEYQYCNFSQKHMNAKDRFEDLTKEGCGRVVMHKEANIIHSYSLQCGIISANNQSVIPEPSNAEFKVGSKGFVREKLESKDYDGIKLADGTRLFQQDSYRNLGKNLLVSILDVFDKNPYNRIYNSRYKSMEMVRRITAFEIFHSTDRFRMFQRSLFGKVKNINALITEILSNKLPYKSVYNSFFTEDEELNMAQWPKNILGLAKPFKNEIVKMKKLKSVSEARQAPSALEEEGRKVRQTVLIIDKLEDRDQVISSDLLIDKMESTKTIEINENREGQKQLSGQQIDTVPIDLDLEQRNCDLVVDGSSDDDNDSDISEVRDNELNQQILLMCQNEKQQNQIISKIMQDNFDERDIEEIQEKYKNKNHLEIEGELVSEMVSEKEIRVALPMQTEVKKFRSNECIRNFASTKDPKYRLSRKIVVNTCDVSSKYKKKLEVVSHNEIIRSRNEHNEDLSSHKKLTAAQEFRKNIYDAIKQEIKEGLRREYDRKRQRERIESKLIDSFRVNQNIKFRANFNGNEVKKMKSRVKLPSLGANMYIITTSTRALQKN